jgi:D-alanyl-D-alanine carboxypeptidase/D-alanyl-D-alanine-endopeptidase (penicillin-binding protein 4)
LSQISSEEALLVADPDGQILCKKNESKKYVPASTLKILTALAAIHYLGKEYRFRTEFYLDREHNLKIKGYGDPLLVSEVWQKIAHGLAARLQGYKDLIVDDTYFVRDVQIPGVKNSANPYDAPVGALCANFNTLFFKRDKAGRIVSAEPQTPMTPLALEKVHQLGLDQGRYTFTHDGNEAARYAGELLVHFLRKTGRDFQGKVRVGIVSPEDRLLFTYRSVFTLEEGLRKMMEFSSNFMANQIFLALGAHEHGSPGTVEKGSRTVSRCAKEVLQLNDIRIVEGSGISRQNRLSALDMLAILRAFEPYRNLLTRKGPLLYKTGTLKGLKTRAGFIECGHGRPYCFVMFLKSPCADIDALTDYLPMDLDNCLHD